MPARTSSRSALAFAAFTTVALLLAGVLAFAVWLQYRSIGELAARPADFEQRVEQMRSGRVSPEQAAVIFRADQEKYESVIAIAVELADYARRFGIIYLCGAFLHFATVYLLFRRKTPNGSTRN